MTKRKRRLEDEPVQHSYFKIKTVEGKTENQANYIRAIVENDITFCSGPSGSGKSMIAAGIAAQHLFNGDCDQIIVTRPLVCVGKDIGALPGDISEKTNPYLVPMQEYFRMFLGNLYKTYVEERKIRYEPLEIMRGSTFHNTYMILDEAQNCTFDQIKMFLTRIGENSKVIINGDIKQNDLRGKSGLESCVNKLKNVDGVAIITLDHSDIQRNGIIGRVLTALESD